MRTFVIWIIVLLAWDVCAKIYRLWANVNTYSPGAIAIDATVALGFLIWGCLALGKA
jgi:hypothetical protein